MPKIFCGLLQLLPDLDPEFFRNQKKQKPNKTEVTSKYTYTPVNTHSKVKEIDKYYKILALLYSFNDQGHIHQQHNDVNMSGHTHTHTFIKRKKKSRHKAIITHSTAHIVCSMYVKFNQ